MSKRKTIGNNPLDALDQLIGSSETHEEKNITDTKTIVSSKLEEKEVLKHRITVVISAEVADKLKDSVYWTPGLTLGRMAEHAFKKAIEELEKERGEEFPRRTAELCSGRPVK